MLAKCNTQFLLYSIGVILEPKKIDLTGDFHTQLDNILFAVRLKMEEVQSLSLLYSDLELALQAHWPGYCVIFFLLHVLMKEKILVVILMLYLTCFYLL